MPDQCCRDRLRRFALREVADTFGKAFACRLGSLALLAPELQ
jgi:hypothetical protein